jgi:hypothetical protein
MSANSLQPMTTAIYMPSIFWHDRQGILSIDVLQQKQSIGPNHVPVYKIATASMQKEIRIWNFRFEQAEPTKIGKKSIGTTAEPKVIHTDMKDLELIEVAEVPKKMGGSEEAGSSNKSSLTQPTSLCSYLRI